MCNLVALNTHLNYYVQAYSFWNPLHVWLYDLNQIWGGLVSKYNENDQDFLLELKVKLGMASDGRS
jgi:hypothetical protein